MQAFFDADVIDVELLYDNAMLAVNYALSRWREVHPFRYKPLPRACEYPKLQLDQVRPRNIRDIAKRFGLKAGELPHIGVFGTSGIDGAALRSGCLFWTLSTMTSRCLEA